LSSSNYTFHPATVSDLGQLYQWLTTPEVQAWWGEPDRELAIIKEDMQAPDMSMLIVRFNDRPFAFAQHYDLRSWPQPCFANLPHGTRAIDTFIGVPDMLNVGHGTAYVKLLAETLCADGAPLIAIDPDPNNLRARKAYKHAGFQEKREIQTVDGPAILMLYPGDPSN